MIKAKSPLVVSIAAALMLGACTTGPVFEETDPNRKAKTGALVGAGVGAVVGNLAGSGDTGATVLGAVVGGAAGAAIGNQMDKQEAELRQSLGNDVGIRNTGDRLIVTMPQDILFATDSSELRPGLMSDLRDVGQSLLAYPNTTAQVVGHTDSDGDAGYNMDLSQRRAQSVVNVLTSEGVPSGRVRAIGAGEDQPIASNLTPEGKAQNRRVEIIILPNA